MRASASGRADRARRRLRAAPTRSTLRRLRRYECCPRDAPHTRRRSLSPPQSLHQHVCRCWPPRPLPAARPLAWTHLSLCPRPLTLVPTALLAPLTGALDHPPSARGHRPVDSLLATSSRHWGRDGMQLRFEGRYPFYLLREGGEAPAALRVRCSLGFMYVGHRLGAADQQRGSQCGLCAACSGHGARPSESTRARLINSFPHIKIFPYFLCLTQPEPSGRRGAARPHVAVPGSVGHDRNASPPRPTRRGRRRGGASRRGRTVGSLTLSQ